MKYLRGIDHVNTDDTETEVVRITSTSEERKRIDSVRISDETNNGRLRFYVEREGLFEGNTYHKTNQATIEDFLEFIIDRELAEGESFIVTLQNDAIGVDAEITGDITYTIP